MKNRRSLLIIIPDRLSEILRKGEVVECYYNPNNFFNEIHIMMINDDQPPIDKVKKMVGNAKLSLHNYPVPCGLFKKTLGWQPFLLKKWLNNAINKFSYLSYDMIRVYGAYLNLPLALALKRGKPVVASLHTHPIKDVHLEKLSFKESLIKHCDLKLWKLLAHVDKILPAYRGIIDYLDKLHISQDKYEVLYNKVCMDYSKNMKSSFVIGEQLRILCVGQQIANKNPEHIIRSLRQIDNVRLDIVGMGPLNQYLKNLVRELGLLDKVNFIDSLSNEVLCGQMCSYDFFVGCIDCIGISKVIIECFLLKLPVIININSKSAVPELVDGLCLKVPNTELGYFEGINKLRSDINLREKFGETAYKHAIQIWEPSKIEKKHAFIYYDILNNFNKTEV